MIALSVASPGAAASPGEPGPSCPQDWYAIGARAADATWESVKGERVIDQVVMALGVWTGGPENPTPGEGSAGYYLKKSSPAGPLTYSLLSYSMGFDWPFEIDWDDSTMPATIELTAAANADGSYRYTLSLTQPVTGAEVIAADTWLPLGSAQAAIPGFLIWGTPKATQSYDDLAAGGYLTVHGQHTTYFPQYAGAACEGNPDLGLWSDKTSVGSWMPEPASRRGRRQAPQEKFRIDPQFS